MKIVLVALIILNLCTIALTFFLYRRSKRKIVKRFWRVIYKLRDEERLSFEPVPKKEAEKTMESAQPFISEKTEKMLLEKLSIFESSQGFTDKNCSLSTLAGDLDTNTKYLSYIIKTYKKTDFNTYINQLRIQYISNKIETNAAYKKYKISYLAEQCGFSSHSKFTAIFKKETGLTPSEFISWSSK